MADCNGRPNDAAGRDGQSLRCDGCRKVKATTRVGPATGVLRLCNECWAHSYPIGDDGRRRAAGR